MVDETTGGKPLMGYIVYTNHGPEWVTLTMGQLMAVDATNPKRPVPSLTIPVTAVTELLAAAEECADSLEDRINNRSEPALERYAVRRLRAAVEKVRGS